MEKGDMMTQKLFTVLAVVFCGVLTGITALAEDTPAIGATTLAVEPTAAPAAEKETLAVAETKVLSGHLPESELKGISTAIEAALGPQYQVINRSALATIMTEVQFQQNSGMVDENTATAEFGKLKGVDKLLIPTVSKVADNYSLVLQMVNCSTGEIVGQSERVTSPNLNTLFGNIDTALMKMGIGREDMVTYTVAITTPKMQMSHGWLPPSLENYIYGLKSALLEQGITLFERQDRVAAMEEMAIAYSPTAAPNQNARINQEEVAGYVVLTNITRFNFKEEAPKKLLSGTSGVRRVRYLDGVCELVRVRDNKLVASIPFSVRQLESSIPMDIRRDWEEVDYQNAMIVELIPQISAKLGEALQKERTLAGTKK